MANLSWHLLSQKNSLRHYNSEAKRKTCENQTDYRFHYIEVSIRITPETFNHCNLSFLEIKICMKYVPDFDLFDNIVLRIVQQFKCYKNTKNAKTTMRFSWKMRNSKHVLSIEKPFLFRLICDEHSEYNNGEMSFNLLILQFTEFTFCCISYF